MDEGQFEQAQRLQEDQVEQAIASRVQYQGESAEYCDGCGVPIPQARRLAVPGCQFCVDCQSLLERVR
ncbi:TraR/DksA C4-type zinc finger protein [Pseudomonas sp. SG20056]|uniref:TraR/DksA C4-type zinc finger protein n=1 Tax=Pseudomonas sp. SG20056 TaxID=3074146 RepID=UPI00287F9E63|nr:TraR/DksA C4-type zinc finger protein [Pseudomonas sp. SG20056]WNF45833.1 TraR/DksA C4-type zinc finger protein [Pseudomonas sp. SG20056]